MYTDRRKEMRVPLLLPVECHGPAGDTHYSYSHDISTRGISLSSKAPFQPGNRYRLLFTVPHYREKMETSGEVRWQTGQPVDDKTGIEFSEPIDLSVPFSAANEALRSLREHFDSQVAQIYETVSDACVWINASGEIIQCDERFLECVGYSQAEVQGYPIFRLAYPDDQEALSNLLIGSQTIDRSCPPTGSFRIESKSGRVLFWKIRVSSEPFQPTSRKIYIEDVTEFFDLKDQKHQLDQEVVSLKGALSGLVIRLDSELRIASVCNMETKGQQRRLKARFKGMDLRKATGLVETKVNGKRLWDKLQYSAHTGKEFESNWCHYQGRTGKTTDLFSPGTFRTKICPIIDLHHRVSSLLMIVKSEQSPDILHAYSGQEAEKRDNLQSILQAAATGHILGDVLKETYNPFTCLLGRLDLLRYKLTLNGGKWKAGNSRKFAHYAEEIKKAEKSIGNLSNKFRCIMENCSSVKPAQIGPLDINRSLSTAITIANTYEGLNGIGIKFEPESKLPTTESNEQELVMIFLIFLLLSRDCLKNVSDTTITCETASDNNHILARMLHNGYIRQDKYLDIIFHNKPLEDYFFNRSTTNFMDTLLYYGNCLLKNNNIKTKITNIPGYFSLSLFIPVTTQQR